MTAPGHAALGDLCEILDSKRVPITKKDRRAGPYPYYGASGVLDHVAGFIFDEPLVLIGEDGAKWGTGERSAFAIDGKCWVNNHAHVIRPLRNRVLDRWIIHYLNFADLLPYVSGLTVPKLNQANLRAIPVPSASLDEQVRVLAILDEGFAAIATARANTEQNLRAARAVFESHLESVFAQRGDGWDSLTELEYLTDPKSPITYGVVKPGGEGNVTFIRGGDLAQGRILTAQLRTITQEVSEQYKRTLLRGGELLISLVGQPGQLAVVPMELAGANIARQVGLIRLQALVHPEFARLFLQSPAGQSALGARQSGSVQQVINLGELKQVRIPVPSLTIQTKVVEALAAANLQTERPASINRRKRAALDALKQSLLHQAFTGAL